MKYAILHPAALLLPLALLTGCARTLEVGEPFPQPPYDPYRAP